MKDLGKANIILGIKFKQDRKNRMLGLSQAGYIDKVLERFSTQNSKKGLLPFRHGVPVSDDQRPKTLEEENMMRQVPYAFVVGSLMYACFVLGQRFVIQLAWLANINQIQDQNIGNL